MTGAELAERMRSYRIFSASEQRLQDAFLAVCQQEGWRVEREKRLSERDVVDFFFPDSGLAVELKVDGGVTAIDRQLDRYAGFDAVRELALLTIRRRHAGVAARLRGKTVTVVLAAGGL